MQPDDIIRISQALLTPVIGVTTLYIAYQQYRLARDKRRTELYDKRIALYRHVSEFALHASGGRPSMDFIVKARAASAEVVFLFGPEVRKYVDDLTFLAIDLWQVQAVLRGDGVEVLKRKEIEATRDKEDEMTFALSELCKKVDDMFMPYLKHDFR